MKRFLSRLLIALAGICFAFTSYLIWIRYSPLTPTFVVDEPIQSNTKTHLPRILSINQLGIYLPIVTTNQKADTTDKGVSYLSSSAIPGEVGNSIIYGHNWPNLLGHLPQVKPGEKITIVFADGQRKDFIVERTSVITADQSHVLEATNDIRLTIYTCTGFLDSQRFVVTAVSDS